MNKRLLNVSLDQQNIVIQNDQKIVLRIPFDGKKTISGEELLSILDYKISDQYEVSPFKKPEGNNKNVAAAEALHSLLVDITDKINQLKCESPAPNEPDPSQPATETIQQ